jgi:flagellar operon protein
MGIEINPLPKQAMLPSSRQTQKSKPMQAFQTILDQKKSSLTLTKHAEARMVERNIVMNETKWQSIAAQVEKAKAKGITDSLVLTDEAALVVSAKNQTVITMMNRQEATEKIFTNINGTIIID